MGQDTVWSTSGIPFKPISANFTGIRKISAQVDHHSTEKFTPVRFYPNHTKCYHSLIVITFLSKTDAHIPFHSYSSCSHTHLKQSKPLMTMLRCQKKAIVILTSNCYKRTWLYIRIRHPRRRALETLLVIIEPKRCGLQRAAAPEQTTKLQKIRLEAYQSNKSKYWLMKVFSPFKKNMVSGRNTTSGNF